MLIDEVPYDPSTVLKTPLLEVTQSSMSSFCSCTQKFVFRYIMMLETRGVSIPLLVGSAVHKGLEILLDPANMENPNLNSDQALQQALRAVDAKIDEIYEQDLFIGNLDTKINKARAQAHACIIGWHINFYDNMPFKVLKTEETFRAVEGANYDSPLEDRMAGQLDGLVLDFQADDISTAHALLETKTKGSLTGFDWVGGLPLDRQIHFYVTAARERWNIPINKIFYNVLGKPQHRSGNTWEALKNRMAEATTTQPEKYYAVEPVLIDEDALDWQKVQWRRIVERMDNLTSTNVFCNTGACGEYGGCPYKPLCLRGADAGDPGSVLALPEVEMYRFKKIHSELE